MRVFEIQESFGLDSLRIAERDMPKPGPGQVLVKIKAASLNYRDLLTVTGAYNPRQPLPLIPLSDGTGEVVELGEATSRFKVGDRVCGIFAQKWLYGRPTKAKLATTLGGPLDGMLAEYVCLHEDGLVKIPDYLSFEEAATLPCAAVTAWNALVTHGNLRAGQTVLVQGTGGVSIFALQIARMMGARVIVTSSSEDKLERARALGADATINYKLTPDWDKKVRELTDGEGVDHVVEVGGAGTFEKSIKAVRFAGRISIIGILSGTTTQLNLIPLLMQNITAQGIIVGSRETFEEMNLAFAQNQIRPVIDKVYSFEDSIEAFKYLASGSHFGKICIRIS
ncbi:MAG: NAD(P)-dependent alcohol dehydrogenase [Acidobacteriota bacterium]|nr:NAD(P)-dependent alcohol dehydrogenase [Blastocatellia bacterium]MDW8413543.1 NAD(P)-dependent alcohol dehydrogenase [Acidobacteriota bacterium]